MRSTHSGVCKRLLHARDEDLRVGEPFEFNLGVQRSYVVTTLNEGLAHRPTGDMGVEQDPHPRPAGP
jgi:hypothetical protein